jgi:hypothetical protein
METLTRSLLVYGNLPDGFGGRRTADCALSLLPPLAPMQGVHTPVTVRGLTRVRLDYLLLSPVFHSMAERIRQNRKGVTADLGRDVKGCSAGSGTNGSVMKDHVMTRRFV